MGFPIIDLITVKSFNKLQQDKRDLIYIDIILMSLFFYFIFFLDGCEGATQIILISVHDNPNVELIDYMQQILSKKSKIKIEI